MSLLKQEYKEGETTLNEALALAIKVLSKTLDLTKLSPDKGEESPPPLQSHLILLDQYEYKVIRRDQPSLVNHL